MAHDSPLGKTTTYVEHYSPEQLFPISRSRARDKISLRSPLPFHGEDLWTGYELSWLNPKGKPEIAQVDFRFSYDSPNIVESKSLKLYLNSFTQSTFDSAATVQATIHKDLTAATQGTVTVQLTQPFMATPRTLISFSGVCLDTLDVSTNTYNVHPQFLTTSERPVQETLYSHLLKSNCLATGQPDWASLLIHYAGPQINHEGLLKYIISFRRHSGFGEHCVEQIYFDILKHCRPEKLTVYARYTRRGGLDINPFRSNFEHAPTNLQFIRQ